MCGPRSIQGYVPRIGRQKSAVGYRFDREVSAYIFVFFSSFCRYQRELAQYTVWRGQCILLDFGSDAFGDHLDHDSTRQGHTRLVPADGCRGSRTLSIVFLCILHVSSQNCFVFHLQCGQ